MVVGTAGSAAGLQFLWVRCCSNAVSVYLAGPAATGRELPVPRPPPTIYHPASHGAAQRDVHGEPAQLRRPQPQLCPHAVLFGGAPRVRAAPCLEPGPQPALGRDHEAIPQRWCQPAFSQPEEGHRVAGLWVRRRDRGCCRGGEDGGRAICRCQGVCVLAPYLLLQFVASSSRSWNVDQGSFDPERDRRRRDRHARVVPLANVPVEQRPYRWSVPNFASIQPRAAHHVQ